MPSPTRVGPPRACSPSYAVVSLIPIAALGFILAADFRSEAQSRGIDQA